MNSARTLALALTLLSCTALVPREAAAQRRIDLRGDRCVLTLPGMENAVWREGLVYKKTAEGDELKFDLYLPAAGTTNSRVPGLAARSGPPPLVIFLNGVGSSRTNGEPIRMPEWGIYRTWARLCAVSGMAAIVHDVRNESAAADAADLLAYVHAHAAELGVAPDQVCIWSCSANVRTGFPLAYDPKNTFVKAAVFYYGNPDSVITRPELPVLLGRAGLDNANINGAMDRFVRKALAANAPVTVLNVHNGHHAFDLFDDDDQSRAAVQATLDWMANQLSPGVETARGLRAVELEARTEVAARNWVSADRALRAWLAAEPENGQAHYEHAGVLYQLRQYDEAAVQYERTIALRAMVPLANYNGACCYALVGKKDKALELLERAVATGAFSDRNSIKNDPDFASIAADPRFVKLVTPAN